MMDWKRFDRIMLEAEFLNKKNGLTFDMVKCLKRNKCWRNDEPYCTYDQFTYKMADSSIRDIRDHFKAMKGQK